MEEKWKDIPGYEKLYQASNLGRIRTHPEKVTRSARFPERHWKVRILKTRGVNYQTGHRVSLWKDGKVKDALVARLVAMTWVDGYEPELTVDHINGNRFDNRAENLEWVSLAENVRRAFDIGLHSCQKAVILTNEKHSFRFRSMSAASRFLGRSKPYISACLSENRMAISITGEKYDIEVA